MLDYYAVMNIANRKYKNLKAERNPYIAPELLPYEIQSDQVRALAYALVAEINNNIFKPEPPKLRIVVERFGIPIGPFCNKCQSTLLKEHWYSLKCTKCPNGCEQK
jgi:hypothetical protein